MKQVIVALDNLSKKEIIDFLDQTKDKIHFIKLGLEVFNAYGKSFIKEVENNYPLKVFLDLKLHDIPATVFKSIRALDGINPEFLTIHLSGGSQMIKEALNARDQYLPQTKILGVSILTSLDKEDTLKIYNQNIEQSFKNLMSLAFENKVDGVILSGHELSLLKQMQTKSSHQLIKITPGIRLEKDQSHDQKRVMSPQEALSNGADYLVIGRSITTNPSILDKSELFTLN